MEFDETPRFWYPRVALAACINFAFSLDENIQPYFRRSEKETKRRKNKNKNLSLTMSSLFLRTNALLLFDFRFYLFFFNIYIYIYIYILFWIHGSYCFIRVRFCTKTIYIFLVHFILNELNSSHFLTSKIFVKISSLKSMTTYHPENRKIFHLSQNSTKLFWVTRFRETNLTTQFVSSSEI